MQKCWLHLGMEVDFVEQILLFFPEIICDTLNNFE